MFNKTFYLPTEQHSHNHKTEVHEHRAPTDESLKLVQEMQQIVFNSIIKIDSLETIIGKILVFEVQSHLSFLPEYIAKFTLNNKEMEVRYAPKLTHKTQTEEDRWVGLRDLIATEIASTLTLDAIKTTTTYKR